MFRNATIRWALVLSVLGFLALAQLAPATASIGFVHAASKPTKHTASSHGAKPSHASKPSNGHNGGATQGRKPGNERHGKGHQGNPGAIKTTYTRSYTTRDYPQLSCNTKFFVVGVGFATRKGVIYIVAKGPHGGFTVVVAHGTYSGHADPKHDDRYRFISGPYRLHRNGVYKIYVSSGKGHFKIKVVHVRNCTSMNPTPTPTQTPKATRTPRATMTGTANATGTATMTAAPAGTATAMATSTATATQTGTGTATTTGYLEICKAGSGALPDPGSRQYTFTITDQGVSFTRSTLLGLCTLPIALPVGTATIVEQASSDTTLVGVSAERNGQSAPVTSDLGARTAVVTIVPGDSSTEIRVTFTNATTPTATGTSTSTATQTATGTNTATQTSTNTATQTSTNTATQTKTATQTSTATQTEMATATQTKMATATATQTKMATATQTGTATGTATATQTEMATAMRTGTAVTTRTGTAVTTQTGTAVTTRTGTAVTTQTGTAVTTQTGTAMATQTGTPVATQTGTAMATRTGTAVATGTGTAVATGTSTATAQLKICKVVTTGSGAPTPTASQDFTFDVSINNGATTRVSTKANSCVQVPGTSAGDGVTIQEEIPNGYRVIDITDPNNNDTVVSKDTPNGTIVLTLGGGASNVTYTNETTAPTTTATTTATASKTATATATSKP